MRLKRVEMVGFKSFMDRTVLDFRDGVTTILGPNGCGKSNVVDAVRWVLGEQSAKQLRGEKMEDVIFKGTQKRKPLSTAEVILTFDNTEGLLDVNYTDVAISRRVTREGGSDYFLNKAPCRLKDLKDLLYDTGAGNNAYSIIEQEMVGQVLNPNENKVRAILEEGSGVVRYKMKRKEALRKLDLTERDLLRVEDIVEEIGRQVRSLARQVGKARRHQRLFTEVKSLELIKAKHSTKRLRLELQELSAQAEALRTEETGDDAELSRIRRHIDEMRPAIEALEADRKDKEYGLSKAEATLGRIEGELLVLREKTESGTRRQGEIKDELVRTLERGAEIETEQEGASTERQALSSQLEAAQGRTRELEKELGEITARHSEARQNLGDAQQMSLGFLQEEAEQKRELTAQETRIQSLNERQEVLERELAESTERRELLRDKLEKAEAAVVDVTNKRLAVEDEVTRHREAEQAAEDRLQAAVEERGAATDEKARAESRHEIAARIAAEYEGYRTGAAALLKDEATKGRLRGALAEAVKVESGWEAAFELLFGEDADALLVDGLQDAHELARRLAEDGLGRGSFMVPLGNMEFEAIDADGLPGRPARELVESRHKADGPLRLWLQNVRVVDAAADAVQGALEHAGTGVSFLAKEGLFVRHDGLVRGGAGARRELSLFGREEQVEELAEELAKVSTVLSARQAAVAVAESQRDQVREAVAGALGQLRSLEEEAREASQEAGSRRAALERQDEHHGEVLRQRDEVRTRLDELFGSVEGMKFTLGRHGEDQQATETRVGELSALVKTLEEEREAASTTAAEARLELTHMLGSERELDSRLHRLTAMSNELKDRAQRLDEEGELLSVNLATWKETIEARSGQLSSLFEERESRTEELRKARETIDVKRGEMEEAQEEMRVITERQRHKAEKLGELENRITRDQLTIQNFEERISEKYQTTIERGYDAIEERELPKELVREDDTYPMEQVEELLELRKDKLDKIGPVNFAAMEEYDQKKARLQFLEQQRDDLRASKEHLLSAIDKINRTARALFKETFEKVRENFRDIFQTLFEGGSADLELVKSDDPLEGDIVIHARPKGKKVDTVALLSGGERALTAISLLFAVYLIKPSPFCLLDEVDAPLDDLNVGRFVRLLERFAGKTQFIVITHNKLTMESADHLYGVTMEENGVSRLVSVTFDQLDAEDPIRALEVAAVEQKKLAEAPAARLENVNLRAPGKGESPLAEATAGNGGDVVPENGTGGGKGNGKGHGTESVEPVVAEASGVGDPAEMEGEG